MQITFHRGVLMKNYKVMIVDDEAEMREGIVQKLDWETLGFEVEAVAENGLEAIEKAESCEVDLLLTDIKMPFMDGLSMISEFRTLHPSAKVVILTGFDDADYARQAIKLGVTEYVLKPVNAGELWGVLARMRAQLDRENDEKRDIAMLRAQYERAKPAMRERFLSELLWRRMGAQEIENAVAVYELAIDSAPGKLLLVFDISLRGAREQALEGELVPISILQIVEETLAGRCHFALCSGLSQIVAVTAWEGGDPVSRAVLIGNDICVRCRRILDIRVACGVSKRYASLTDTPAAYAEARAALDYRGEPGLGRAIYIGDAETDAGQPAVLDERSEQLLLSAMRAGGLAQVETVVDGLMRPLEQTQDAWQKQAYLVSVCNSLNRIVLQYGLSGETELTERIASRFAPPADTAGIRAWLGDICATMYGYVSRRRESMPKLLAEQAVRYIEENYAKPSLSAEDVCAHLHVSRSYFFEVFKKQTGRSFVQYLTDVRMEHAVILLQDPAMKTLSVAAEVGYEEPNYFSHVFKRRFGVTPARYRRREADGV